MEKASKLEKQKVKSVVKNDEGNTYNDTVLNNLRKNIEDIINWNLQ